MNNQVRLRRRGELSPTALGVVALVEGWGGAFLVIHVAAGVPSQGFAREMAGGAALLFLTVARGVTAHGLAINLLERRWWRLPAIAMLLFVIATLQSTLLIEAFTPNLGGAPALAFGLAISIWPLLLLRDCADLAHRPPPWPVASAVARLPAARLLGPTRRAARPTAPHRTGGRPCAGDDAAPPRAAPPAS